MNVDKLSKFDNLCLSSSESLLQIQLLCQSCQMWTKNDFLPTYTKINSQSMSNSKDILLSLQ